jgi:hypothetical protein
MKPFVLLVVSMAPIALTLAYAGDRPNLASTDLYVRKAHSCEPVGLATWSHPTKDVLAKYKVPLDALDLCNDKKYPIFHVRFQYEPMLRTADSYFKPLYAEMFKANGNNSLAFIATSSAEVIEIEKHQTGWQDIYERYAP